MRTGGIPANELIMEVWEWCRNLDCVVVWKNDRSGRVGVYVVYCFELPDVNQYGIGEWDWSCLILGARQGRRVEGKEQ